MKTSSSVSLIIQLSALSLLALWMASCSGASARQRAAEPLPAQLVNVMVVQQQTYTPSLEVTGMSKPVRTVTLSVERAGKLTKLVPRVGQTIQKGDLVAQVRTLGL